MNALLPFLAAVLTALLSTGIALLAYNRSRQVDAVAEQAGIRTEASQSVQQVVTGLNTLVQALQGDNLSLREVIRELRTEISDLRQEIIKLRQEVRSAISGPQTSTADE